MFELRFTIYDEGNLFSRFAKKYRCEIKGTPISCTKKKSSYEYLAIGTVSPKDYLSSIIRELKKVGCQIKRIDDKAFIKYKQKSRVARLYSADYFPRPVIINGKGVELWTILTESKKKAFDLLENIKQEYSKVTLLSLKKAKIGDLFHAPYFKLTQIQKENILLAHEMGYYDVPRKCSIGEIAAILNKSYSTTQVHLRKAEKVILTHTLEQIR